MNSLGRAPVFMTRGPRIPGTRAARTGFTLMEVLLVLAILVIFGAMAWPSVETMYGDVRLTAASDQIRAAWAEARTHAIEEGQVYRFAVQLDGKYRAAPDTIDHWSDGNSNTTRGGLADSEPLVLEEQLPKGVSFADQGISSGSTDGNGWITLMQFQPDGSANRDVEVVFEAKNCRSLQLKLRGLTGSVTVHRLTEAPR